jgi:NADH-quinone oxidoreductase subunit H
MILIAALTAVFFLGGWLSPLDGYLSRGQRAARHPAAGGLVGDGFHWLFLKLFLFLFGFCGTARRSRATATTRSCASAGRS